MARWKYAAGASTGVLLAAGAWWLLSMTLTPPHPDLGPVIVVSGSPSAPALGPGDEDTPTSPADPPHAEPDVVETVTPAPPQDAGDDDDPDDDSDDVDD